MKSRSVIAGAFTALIASQAALAYDIGVDTPDVTLLLSGASATEVAITDLVTNNLCVGNIDRYDGVNQRAVFCDMNAASVPGLSGTLKVLVRKSSQGGSGGGVRPVCDAPTGGTVPFAIFVTAGAGRNCSQTTPGNWSCPGTSGGTVTTESLIPEAGTSDVRPNELFANSSTGCGANVFPSYETVMGIAVSLQLRNALQEVQGLSVGTDDAANMPSLSTELVASIMTGRVKKWSDVQINGQSLTSEVGELTPNGYGITGVAGTDRVTICRRTDTSGTYASQNIRLLQRNCASGALAPASSNAFPADANGPVIPTGSGGADVLENCLDQFSRTAQSTATSALRNGSRWAIGHDALDRNPLLADPNYTTRAWRFVRLNGVTPTFVNVANGSYKFSVSSTIQWKTLAGDRLAIMQKLQTDSAKPELLGPVAIHHFFGDSGVMALAENGYTVQYDGAGLYDTSKPVTPFTHNPGGTFSNCLDGLVPSVSKAVPLEAGN